MLSLSPLRSFVAVLSFAAVLGCSPAEPDDPSPADADLDGDADGDTDGGDGDNRCVPGSSPGSIALPGASTLEPVVEDVERCLLWGIDRFGSELFQIDTVTGSVRDIIAIGSTPTDLALSLDGATVYVAVFGASAIVAVDAASGEVLSSVTTDIAPFRIAPGTEQRVYYVERDGYTAIHEVNFANGSEAALTSTDFREPDLATSADGHHLYLGEGNLAGSRLVRFDLATPGLPVIDSFTFDGGFTPPTVNRGVVLDPGLLRVYYGDRAFSAVDLPHMLGWLGDHALATSPDGRVVASGEGLYDARTFMRFATRPHPGSSVHFSSDGRFLYEFDAATTTLHRSLVGALVGAHALGETLGPAGPLAQHRFNQILADPERPLIYGIDAQKNQIVIIDRTSLLPLRAEIIGSAPTDMALSPQNDDLYVATFGATEIAVLDLNTTGKSLKSVIVTDGNPFRVAVGTTSIVYSEQDQLSTVTVLARDGDLVSRLEDALFQPDLELDPTGQYLYAGESAAEDAKLRRYDISQPVFLSAGETATTYYYPARRVIVRGGSVYYAGRKFDASTLAQVGDFGEDIVLVTQDGRFAVSRRTVYAADTLVEVDGLPVDSPLVVADSDSTTLYQFDNETGALFVQALPL